MKSYHYVNKFNDVNATLIVLTILAAMPICKWNQMVKTLLSMVAYKKLQIV